MTYLWRPVLEDRPFRYDEAYTREVYRRTASGVKLGAKITMTKGYPDTEQRGLALLNRLQFGFASILAGFKAEANWHRLLRSFFHEEAAAEDGGRLRARTAEDGLLARRGSAPPSLARAPDPPRPPRPRGRVRQDGRRVPELPRPRGRVGQDGREEPGSAGLAAGRRWCYESCDARGSGYMMRACCTQVVGRRRGAPGENE